MALALCSVIVGFVSWNRLSRELRILVVYLTVGFVVGIVIVILAFQRINNLWLMQVYTPIQFSFLMWVFSHWSSGAVKRVFLFSIPTFILFWGVMFLFFEDIGRFNAYSKPTSSLILVAASGYLLYQTNKESDEVFYRSPKFWVASGTLVYFSGMIVLYALFNQLLTVSAEQLALLWAPIQTTASVLSYLMYIMSFLCLSPRLRPQM